MVAPIVDAAGQGGGVEVVGPARGGLGGSAQGLGGSAGACCMLLHRSWQLSVVLKGPVNTGLCCCQIEGGERASLDFCGLPKSLGVCFR